MEYVVDKPFNAWFFWFFLIGALCTFVAWLAFARVSMARIKRLMKKDGVDPVPWDGISGGIVFFAFAIALPERYALRISQLIDVRLVRSLSLPRDKVLALVFLLTADTWLIVSLFAMVFGWDTGT